MTLLHAVSGLTAGVNGQLCDSSASVQERPAASSDRRPGVPYRTEYNPAGLCRCLYICIPLQDLAISMLVTFIVQQQPLLTSLGPGLVLQNSC